MWWRIRFGFWTACHAHFGIVDWAFHNEEGYIRCMKCLKRFNV